MRAARIYLKMVVTHFPDPANECYFKARSRADGLRGSSFATSTNRRGLQWNFFCSFLGGLKRSNFSKPAHVPLLARETGGKKRVDQILRSERAE
jgi:hypothetical protein